MQSCGYFFSFLLLSFSASFVPFNIASYSSCALSSLTASLYCGS